MKPDSPLNTLLDAAAQFDRAARYISFDQLTVCPPEGREAAGDLAVLLRSEAFARMQAPELTEAVLALHARRDELDTWERALADHLYRNYLHTKNRTREDTQRNGHARTDAFLAWCRAREARDYRVFEPYLAALVEEEKARVLAFEPETGEEKNRSAYARMLDENERGITEETLDRLFAITGERLPKLLAAITDSGRHVRTDFLSRPVTDAQQGELTRYLMDLVGFDSARGICSLTEHPFTELLGPDDIRIATHYEENSFLSNLYSVLHECGHALFEQLQPRKNHEYHIEDIKTMGMHESVSRFYENVIGRSRSFIHLIYPTLCGIFPQVFFDVGEEDLYEAVNVVTPSLIRMDADELTYTLHILIRYELEKQLVGGTLSPADLPAAWSDAYRKYLGVVPADDVEGVLQDSHWADGFGYFPTYALGNFYNAMYRKRICEDLDLDALVEKGDFASINSWMAEHVFFMADRLRPDEWIRGITGRSLCADDYLDYLEEKYSELYRLGDSYPVNKEFESYRRHMIRIRRLSALQLDNVTGTDAYRTAMSDNFRKIGELAKENHKVMEQVILPILNSKDRLPVLTVRQLQDFNQRLMDAWTHENVDLPVMSLLSKRMMADADASEDDTYIICQLDQEIIACIALVVETRRILSMPEISDRIRKRGLAAYDKLIAYLDHDRFLALPEESRELILINSRYGDGLFISLLPLTKEERRTRVENLERSIRLAEDPFYREAAPHYDWEYHLYRAYQYYSSFDEFDNGAGFDAEVLKKVARYGEALEELWRSSHDRFGKVDNFSYIHSHTLRNRMHAGLINRDEYRDGLAALYAEREPNSFDVDSITNNIEIPSEYIATLDPRTISEEQFQLADTMYREALSYVLRMPKTGVFYELMDYYAPLIFNFVELPGSIRFEEMVLRSFAAFHPPTYIHSIMVAKISRCLTSHLIRTSPELFIGLCGCGSTGDVREKSHRIEHFIYHAALCHDFGKLIIIDTIFMYGRALFHSEFDIIRQHPALGAMLLSRYTSTRDYADVARGHHVWYDGSSGYPEDFSAAESPLNTAIFIVACADCMDAATDSVGRSYNSGTTLDTYIEEVRAGAGTRYAPWLPDLLDREEVLRDLRYLLSEGRQSAYRKTWLLLRGVQDSFTQ